MMMTIPSDKAGKRLLTALGKRVDLRTDVTVPLHEFTPGISTRAFAGGVRFVDAEDPPI